LGSVSKAGKNEAPANDRGYVGMRVMFLCM
jgi:hypothetical protein